MSNASLNLWDKLFKIYNFLYSIYKAKKLKKIFKKFNFLFSQNCNALQWLMTEC